MGDDAIPFNIDICATNRFAQGIFVEMAKEWSKMQWAHEDHGISSSDNIHLFISNLYLSISDIHLSHHIYQKQIKGFKPFD